MLFHKLKKKFNTLFSRLLAVMVLGVVLALIISNLIWVQYYDQRKYQDASSMGEELATSMASTVSFFGTLPRDYRHIVLTQLRNMGGARFFVSVNEHYIDIQPIPSMPLADRISHVYSETLKEKLGQKVRSVRVTFASPENLKVFNNDVLFSELPDRWVQNALILKDRPPLLVAQVEFGPEEWLYLAALLPDPYFLTRNEFLQVSQIIFIALLITILLIISWISVRWLTMPLRHLAGAAQTLGKDPLRQVQVPLSGTREVIETSRAFNAMQQRLIRFIEDRERLFAAISHDLKTPITRLRLRAEMLDESSSRTKMIQDLEELEELVKGALEFSQGTDVHQDGESIDIMQMMEEIREEVSLVNGILEIEGDAEEPFTGKALALKRCFSNIIHNAVFYGNEARVIVQNTPTHLLVRVIDNGPGVPEEKLGMIFEPYVRLEGSRSRNTGGSGLGLSIARNIARAHGGNVELRNHPDRGLVVTIRLPRG